MTTDTLSKKILLLCSRLDMPGGIERSVVNIANLLQANGHNVTVLVLDQTPNLFYPLNPEIQLESLSLTFGITNEGITITRKISFLKDIKKLRTRLRIIKPELIISTEYQFTIAAYFAKKGLKIDLYSREAFHFNGLQKNQFWQTLIRWIYPRLNGVICLNEDEAALYKKIGCNTKVIPNYIAGNKLPSTTRKKLLLTVGRLSWIKGADLIPVIAEEVFQRFPDWQWLVIGDGQEEEHLHKELERRKLQDNIQIRVPASYELENVYKEASVYILTSRFEGFPNVLLEAMSFGLPCIAFDCPTGPRHIIHHNVDGILVANENGELMAKAIIRLIREENKRDELAKAAIVNIRRFSPENIYELWKRIIEKKLL